MNARNVLIAQSGGPTAAINASLAGILSQCLQSSEIGEIYGALHGIEGVLSEQIIDLKAQIKSDEDIKRLSVSPAMALGSCRLKLPEAETDKAPYEKVQAVFERFGIGYFFYIGGNDSMDTAMKISDYFESNGIDIKVIGIPKTIDNDLEVTDHTPGYGSAAKYVATTMLEIGRDCSIYNVPSVTIVEIMGRSAGWIAAAAAVPRYFGEKFPQLIYLPEVSFEIGKFLKDLREEMSRSKGVVVAVSEGVRVQDKNNRNAAKQKDAFGHEQLAGVAVCLEELVKEKIGCKTRSIELNIMQRCAAHVASKTDIDEGFLIGGEAVNFALQGNTGKVVYFERQDEPYRVSVSACDLKLVANREKQFPAEWINDTENGIRDEGVRYILPLIAGSVEVADNGFIPDYFRFDHSRLVRK